MRAQRRLALAALASIGVCGISAPAWADGMPRGPRPDPYAYTPGVALDYNWTGIYFGGHVGGAVAEWNWSAASTGEPTKHNDAGFTGGGQVGLQKQWDWIVVGAESPTPGRSSAAPPPLRCWSAQRWSWQATAPGHGAPRVRLAAHIGVRQGRLRQRRCGIQRRRSDGKQARRRLGRWAWSGIRPDAAHYYRRRVQLGEAQRIDGRCDRCRRRHPDFNRAAKFQVRSALGSRSCKRW